MHDMGSVPKGCKSGMERADFPDTLNSSFSLWLILSIL